MFANLGATIMKSRHGIACCLLLLNKKLDISCCEKQVAYFVLVGVKF